MLHYYQSESGQPQEWDNLFSLGNSGPVVADEGVISGLAAEGGTGKACLADMRGVTPTGR
jgi:hypothetical protein